jgi:hypothetical protein
MNAAPPRRADSQLRPGGGWTSQKEIIRMSTGGYYNQPVADWGRRNVGGRVEVRTLFSSRVGMILTYALLFCVPGAFFALGLLLLALGAKGKDGVGAFFFFGLLTLIPCGLIALLGAYVRRGFVKSLDAEGVRGSFGQRFPWGKLHYVDHVTKIVRAGGVTRRIKDNQLELVFEGGKLIIPPMLRDRAAVWELINGMPAEVRDDGVPRAGRSPIRTQEDLMRHLESLRGASREGG